MSLDPMANGRLNRWRHKGDGPATYTAGSKQFADDVIVILDDIDRLQAEIAKLRVVVDELRSMETIDWLRALLADAIELLETAGSGYIPGCGEDLRWNDRCDKTLERYRTHELRGTAPAATSKPGTCVDGRTPND